MSLLPKKSGVHSPFSLFDDDFSDLMQGFFFPMRREGGERTQMPRIDVKEMETAFEIKADLPGMKKDNIELTVHNGVLTISATREDEHKEEKEGELIRRERAYGRYMRQIPLGNHIDEKAVHASFEDGVLQVTVPKLEAVEAGKVKVAIK
jgi:HSP20 family protein